MIRRLAELDDVRTFGDDVEDLHGLCLRVMQALSVVVLAHSSWRAGWIEATDWMGLDLNSAVELRAVGDEGGGA